MNALGVFDSDAQQDRTLHSQPNVILARKQWETGESSPYKSTLYGKKSQLVSIHSLATFAPFPAYSFNGYGRKRLSNVNILYTIIYRIQNFTIEKWTWFLVALRSIRASKWLQWTSNRMTIHCIQFITTILHTNVKKSLCKFFSICQTSIWLRAVAYAQPKLLVEVIFIFTV